MRPSGIAAIASAAARIGAAAVLGPQPGVRGAAVELGADAEVARGGDDDLADRGRVVEHVAELRAQAARVEVRGAEQAVLLGDREQQLDARRASPRRSRGARPRGSPRRRPCCRRRGCRRWRSPSRRRPRTGSIGALWETVSRCAHSRIERSPRPGMRASRLPAPAPAGPAASSSSTSRPIARSRAATSSATARSSPNGLEIRQSSANVSLRRAFSASLAGLTSAAGTGPRRRPLRAAAASADDVGGLRQALLRAAQRGADELAEQRRRAVRARLELGVVLRGHEERVVVDLDDLDQALVRRGARDHQPRGLEPAAQEVVDLVAVAVALVDHGLAVDLAGRACPRGA